MNVREATADDAYPIANLFRVVAGTTYKTAGNDRQLKQWLDEEANTSIWSERVTSPDYYVLVADDGDVQGSGYIRRNSEIAYFGGFYTYKPGHGISSSIFDQLLAKAKEWRCRRAHCEVWEKLNASRSFFEHHGFSIQDKHPGRTFGQAYFLDYYREL